MKEEKKKEKNYPLMHTLLQNPFHKLIKKKNDEIDDDHVFLSYKKFERFFFSYFNCSTLAR